MASPWRRACTSCTKSKRQCTKGLPVCRRCADKRIPCIYPPARRIVHAETDMMASASSSVADAPADAPSVSQSGGNDADSCDLGFPPLSLTPAEVAGRAIGCRAAAPAPIAAAGPQPQAPPDATSSDTWFLTPESWFADFTPPPVQSAAVMDGVIRRFIESVQSWLRRWVTEGSSPLHHRNLYREKMPRHIQDAYTAIAMYHTLPPSNSHNHSHGHNHSQRTSSTASADARATATRILDDRATQLLEDQALSLSLGKNPDIFDHLSRVQALLAYQTIRLFDGDVRMRAQAEALIPTLALWARQLLDCARESLTRGARFLAELVSSGYCSGSGFGAGAGFAFNPIPNSGHDCGDDGASPGSESSSSSGGGIRGGGGGSHCSEEGLWRAWILVESVRRSWSIATYIQETYMYMKQGWSECPGRVTITMRGGLWDAKSPYAWYRACREEGALFLPTTRTESLFYDKRPEDVDEFSLSIMELGFGEERLERWIGEKGGRGRGKALMIEGWDGEMAM
ncbi:uncharacterized protein GGS22DRAFT_67566 [Annulohypoxylon maeteangense]|uniref:uncharacterized protein n=1 Tax=Annulohypoxylon maeteangense TaxID=1927788 RepID=UPI002007577D|nr:uncharacterized protein GGS22DRAFT_67566 [Annulohypoxylon maeteangense]KAI0889123.1 hypothetical protein GGS22DRAFT_67566 [Annulohypoxylon maeteangense]